LGNRDHHSGDCSSTWPVNERDGSILKLDQALDDRQPQSSATGAGCEERLEYPVAHVWSDARPAVSNLDAAEIVRSRNADVNIAFARQAFIARFNNASRSISGSALALISSPSKRQCQRVQC